VSEGTPLRIAPKEKNKMINKKNKNGWMKIVEAFTSIMLIAGVLIVIAGSLRQETQSFSSAVYDSEYAILREIQLNNSLRENILAVPTLPVDWNDFESSNLANVKNKIIDKTPSYFDCVAKLCEISGACSEITPPDRDVFVKSVFIGANLNDYKPRKLNLFCWNG